VLIPPPDDGPGGDDAQRAAVYEALREGRCYLAMDSLAPARGFRLWASGSEHVEQGAEGTWADGAVLHARLPASASLSVLRDGQLIASHWGAALDLPLAQAGVHRLQASLPAHGRMRTWIVSNPVYLR
jgi:hypothetical protein